MIGHVTIGAEHLLIRDPVAGMVARRCLSESTDCPSCGADLWAGGTIVGPARRDARSGLALECECGRAFEIKRGAPLEVD